MINATISQWALVLLTVLALGQSFSPMPIATPPRSSTSPNTQLHYASTERSCVELVDPATGCEVVLVGCFHGSPSSGKDVEREVQKAPTDVVALELCASRFADLKRMMAEPNGSIRSTQEKKNSSPSFLRFWRVVASTIQQKGLSTGLATGILGGVSGLQTALSGFTPGLEFITAVEASPENCDIILADQSVDETVEKVGQLPQVIQSMWKEIMENGRLDDTTQWSRMAVALRTALAGDPELGNDYQVNVARVVTRNQAAISEMARLMVPPVVATQLALMTVNQALFPEPVGEGGIMASLLEKYWYPMIQFNPLQTLMDAAPHVLILSLMFSTAYTFLAVPITQVILSERDDQLTEGIRAACRIAASKHENGEGGNGRVVAVLGLLHVNGIAKRLLESKEILEGNVELDTELLAK